MRKLLVILLASVLLVSLAAGCSSTDTDEPAVFTYSSHYEPDTLDTNKVSTDVSNNVLYLLSAGLVRNVDGEIVAEIAEDWSVSNDGLTYTFYLRESTWSNGDPVTAHDFEYSFKRYFDPDTGATFVDNYYMIKNAEAVVNGEVESSALGVTATDDYTLEIELEHPDMFFVAVLGSTQYFYPLNKDFVEEHGQSYSADPEKLLTNGPFNLESWDHESEMIMVKNDNYWNADSIKLDKIERLIIQDDNTVAAMYDSGELDYMRVPGSLVSQYPDAVTGLTGGTQFLQFNVEGKTEETGKVMSNLNFRMALSYAIDREAITSAVAGPANQATDRFNPPGTYGVEAPFSEEYPYTGVPVNGDATRANEYLDKALDELGMTKDKLPELTYLAMESSMHQLYAQALTAAWDSVLGLDNIDINVVPIPQAIQGCMDREYDIYLQGLSTSVDPIGVIDNYIIGAGINWTGWADETFTGYVTSRNTTVDPQEFFDATFAAEEYILAYGPVASLWHTGDSYVHKDYVSGLIRSTTGADLQLAFVEINK